MKNRPHSAALITAFAILTLATSATAATAPAKAATPAGTEKPAVSAKTGAASAPEKPPAGFPLTLLGFFGKEEDAEASLRLRDSGKSAWVKPGDSFGGWTLESLSPRTGMAVIVSGNRRVALRLAGESAGAESAPTPGRRYSSMRDSIIVRRDVMAFWKHPESGDEQFAIGKRILERLAKEYPELVDAKTGKLEWNDPAVVSAKQKPDVQQFIRDETRRLYQESTHPGIIAIRDGWLAFFDAEEQVKPRDDDGADLPATTPEERANNKTRVYNLRVMEEADRLYLSRGGDPDTAEYDKRMKEFDARNKAEADAEAEQEAAEAAAKAAEAAPGETR